MRKRGRCFYCTAGSWSDLNSGRQFGHAVFFIQIKIIFIIKVESDTTKKNESKSKTKKIMKKFKTSIVLLLIACMFSSCGLILGGKRTDCQRKKPTAGQPKRQIRPWALVGDIILCETVVPIIVDFATGGIYKPCDPKVKKVKEEKKK